MKKISLKFNKNRSSLFKFGVRVYSALVENFSQTFFVGGMVRDLILKRKIVDIDIATEANPEQIVKILSEHNITTNDLHKEFGNVVATQGSSEIEITTFRKDLKGKGRFYQVEFLKSPKSDSKRRDFTINSLYLSPKKNQVLDFQNGIKDLKQGQIKFIGRPQKRIQEDPLRIVRALRFSLILNFKLEKNSRNAIVNNFRLINNLTTSRVEKEIKKIKLRSQKNILKKVINNPKLLDKFFK